MRILLVTPPMTQLNSPYPATPYLTGALKGMAFDVEQQDFSLMLALKIFARRSRRLKTVKNHVRRSCQPRPDSNPGPRRLQDRGFEVLTLKGFHRSLNLGLLQVLLSTDIDDFLSAANQF